MIQIRVEMEVIEKLKKLLLGALPITILLLGLIVPVSAKAGEINGPGTGDGSQGTYFWHRDNKWTGKDSFWANRGHLKLNDGKTHVFTWRGIDDSAITMGSVEKPKEAWHVFILDAGEGSHGWEQIVMQSRTDEAWLPADHRVVRLLVNWGGGGQVVVPIGTIDLRLIIEQNTGDDKWHIEAWYNTGGGWTQFYTEDNVDIATSWSGLPGDLTQACAGIQIDKDSDGTLSFHPASPLSQSK